MGEADIEDLARRAAAGDARALDELLRHVQPLVMARCGRFLPNRLDAEEACQDALLAVSRRISTFEGRARFTTWLFQVTSNAAIDRYRKLKRRRSVLVDPPEAPVGGGAVSVRAGGRIDLLEAVEHMDQKFAEPMLLRDLCDLDYDEIARQLGVPEGTAKSRTHTGRERLRQALYGNS